MPHHGHGVLGTASLVKRSEVVPNCPLANHVGALCSLQNANVLGLGRLEFTESTIEALGSTLEIDVVASKIYDPGVFEVCNGCWIDWQCTCHPDCPDVSTPVFQYACDPRWQNLGYPSVPVCL